MSLSKPYRHVPLRLPAVRYGITTQSPASSTVITAEPWMVLASYGSMRSFFALAINTVPPESLLGYLIAVSKWFTLSKSIPDGSQVSSASMSPSRILWILFPIPFAWRTAAYCMMRLQEFWIRSSMSVVVWNWTRLSLGNHLCRVGESIKYFDVVGMALGI